MREAHRLEVIPILQGRQEDRADRPPGCLAIHIAGMAALVVVDGQNTVRGSEHNGSLDQPVPRRYVYSAPRHTVPPPGVIAVPSVRPTWRRCLSGTAI